MNEGKKGFYIPLFVFFVGLLLLLYPSTSRLVSKVRAGACADAYTEYVLHLSDGEKNEAFLEAKGYNRRLALLREEIPFTYAGSEAETDEYRSLLPGPDGEMCVLEIPSLSLTLPVLHGTSEEVLTGAVGHMFGTSLPAGGADTHSVIAGHAGLPTAELFTNLKELKRGDDLYIGILGERHHYRIFRLLIVLPEEADRYLQIQKGRDLLTLYTCTPPGVNDKRLLVQAGRVSGTV